MDSRHQHQGFQRAIATFALRSVKLSYRENNPRLSRCRLAANLSGVLRPAHFGRFRRGARGRTLSRHFPKMVGAESLATLKSLGGLLLRDHSRRAGNPNGFALRHTPNLAGVIRSFTGPAVRKDGVHLHYPPSKPKHPTVKPISAFTRTGIQPPEASCRATDQPRAARRERRKAASVSCLTRGYLSDALPLSYRAVSF